MRMRLEARRWVAGAPTALYPDTRSAKINARTEKKKASGRRRTLMVRMGGTPFLVYPLDG
jgi:hypothetical protein